MANYKPKDSVNVHKIIPGFGGININETMPAKLVDICIEAGLTDYFEETQIPTKTDGSKSTGKAIVASTGSTGTAE